MPSVSNKLPLLLLLAAAALFAAEETIRRFVLPLRGKIASKFGERINPVTKVKEFHNGIDIQVPEGTKVVSPAPGVVANVYKSDIGGNQIVLKHTNGYTTGYAHLSKSLVKIGDKLSKGQLFALSGKTGQVTGPHLHLSVRDASGKYVNPEKQFSFS